ncbi:MAG TPA: TolC family protein [Candidatus Acidoferrales bacterium]|nr:TolC family protein [Candidatus Acidoferrales bacterium]
MRRLILYVGLFWASTISLAAQAPGHPMTLREALDMLHSKNPVLAANRLHAEAALANEVTAGLRPNPVFTSANEDFNVFKPSEFDIRRKQEFTDSVLQTIERGHKRQLRVESARWGTQLAQEAYQDIGRQLEFAVKSAFVTMLLTKSNLQLAVDNLRDYKETVRLNEIRLKAGEISPTELDRIKSEQARFENDLLNAQLGLQQARVQLEALLGLPDLPQQFDIQGDLAAPNLSLSLEELTARALANRPDYLAARDTVSKSEADVRLALANGATDIAVGSEYKRNGPDNTLGFTVQIPLRIFDRNQGEKLRTQRELEASKAGELAAQTMVRSDVAQAYEAYQSARARALLYSQDYLERARRIRNKVEFSYRHGGASLLEYLDAVRSYRDTELAWRSASAQFATAVHQLSFVTATEVWP